MLESKGRLELFMPPLQWAAAALAGPGISLAPLTPEIAVEACHLPGEFHKDPVDRMIVATARDASQIRTVRSSLAVAMRAPSGL